MKNIMDFSSFSVNEKKTKKEGEDTLTKKAYAYVPDADNPSTWKLRIDDEPDNTNNLIRYVHTIHPHCKIQVEFKDKYDMIDIWKKRMNK